MYYSQIYEIVRLCSSDRLPFTIVSVISYRRTQEEEEKSKNVWLKGHTGSLSL